LISSSTASMPILVNVARWWCTQSIGGDAMQGTDVAPAESTPRLRAAQSPPPASAGRINNQATHTRPSRHANSRWRGRISGPLMQEHPIKLVERVAGLMRIPALRHRRPRRSCSASTSPNVRSALAWRLDPRPRTRQPTQLGDRLGSISPLPWSGM
jgi:hypothetical protein